MKRMRNNLILKCVLVVLVIAIVVITSYYVAVGVKNDDAKNEEYPTTTYEILANKDLENFYPSTPSEVLKLYSRYLKYIYNTETSDEEFEVLVDKVRMMWSKEWLELNERSEHILSFRNEVTKFIEGEKVMSNYTVDESSKAEKFVTPDGVDGRTLIGAYLFTEKKETSKTYMKFYFLLEDEKWKILYYEIVDEKGNSSAEESKQDDTDESEESE